MPIHVTIDPMPSEDGLTVDQIAACMLQLKPTSIDVDCAGAGGRVVLASLQAKGLPAKALEKRPRPALPEVQRIEELSKLAAEQRDTIEVKNLELELLREYKHDIQILIARLE